MPDHRTIFYLFHAQFSKAIDNQCRHADLAAAKGIVIVIVSDIDAVPGRDSCFMQSDIKNAGIRFNAVHLARNNQVVKKIDQPGCGQDIPRRTIPVGDNPQPDGILL